MFLTLRTRRVHVMWKAGHASPGAHLAGKKRDMAQAGCCVLATGVGSPGSQIVVPCLPLVPW